MVRAVPTAVSRAFVSSALVTSVLLGLLASVSPVAAQAAGPALSTPTLVLSAAPCDPIAPDLTPLPGGGFVAGWLDGRAHVSRFDRFGALRSPERRVPEGENAFRLGLQTAVSPNGRIAVGWIEEGGVQVQLLTPEGFPMGPVLELGGASLFLQPDLPGDLFDLFDLVADPAGGFLAVWLELHTGMVRIGDDGETTPIVLPENAHPLDSSFRALLHSDGSLWWIDRLGLPTSPPSSRLRIARTRLEGPDAFEVEVLYSEIGFNHSKAVLKMDAQGEVVAAWRDGGLVFAQRLDAQGETLGEPIPVTDDAFSSDGGLDLAVDAEGNFAVVFNRDAPHDRPPETPASFLLVRSFAADGTPLGPARELASVPDNQIVAPTVAPSGPGEATAAWWWWRPSAILPPDCGLDSEAIFARRFPLGGDRTLFLGDGRFRVEVAWEDPFNGGSGVGHAIPDTSDSGGFWFFDPANTELKVKIIDGRTVNGRFWFFYGALSNVEYRIAVTDQRTGLAKTYDNPPGVFGSFADTFAFPAP